MDSLVTLAWLLVMVGRSTAQLPRRACGVDASPHPQGICGDALIRARSNLCFLLYTHTSYSNLFSKRRPGRRSPRAVPAIMSLPVDAFTKMDFLHHEKSTDIGDMKKTESETAAPTDFRKLLGLPMRKGNGKESLDTTPAVPATKDGSESEEGELYALAGGKHEEDPLKVSKRSGIVCECCFNRCRPSMLARYC